MRTRRYTEEQFITAVASSKSKAQALKKLGLAAQGGNYRTITKHIKKLGLDTSHMTGQRWSKGLKMKTDITTQDYLLNRVEIPSYRLKNRLIKEGYLHEFCYDCGRTKWMNQKIPLELDHIDGRRLNNNLSNLRLLCPNCHALTPTYKGKNKKKRAMQDSNLR